jgi:hypothetical protein
MEMRTKSLKTRGLLAFAATFIVLAFALPALSSYFLGASSSLCLDPTPANQIKSIQIFPEIKQRPFSHFFSQNGNPFLIRVHINPYYSSDKVPVLSIDTQTKQMIAYEDCDCKTTNGYSLFPFTSESMAQILTAYQAPHSPQQGAVDSAEVYEVLRIVSETDIRNSTALSGIPLKHYKFSYIFPEKANPDLLTCFLSSIVVGLAFARNKKEAS